MKKMTINEIPQNVKITSYYLSSYSLLLGKPSLSRNLFLRNEPNFNNANSTANPYSSDIYNDLQPKPKNGTNPNEANFKKEKPQHSSETQTKNFFMESKANFRNANSPVFQNNKKSGKRTQFQGVKSAASNCCRKVYNALLPKGNEPKRTQLKPIKANFAEKILQELKTKDQKLKTKSPLVASPSRPCYTTGLEFGAKRETVLISRKTCYV